MSFTTQRIQPFCFPLKKARFRHILNLPQNKAKTCCGPASSRPVIVLSRPQATTSNVLALRCYFVGLVILCFLLYVTARYCVGRCHRRSDQSIYCTNSGPHLKFLSLPVGFEFGFEFGAPYAGRLSCIELCCTRGGHFLLGVLFRSTSAVIDKLAHRA